MAGLFRMRGGVRGRAVRDWLGLAAVVAAIAPGCGGSDGSPGPLASVSGRVLLANGKPLTRGRVTFVSKDASAPPASGDLGPDGSFKLTTRTPDDGAVPGDYKVRIEPAAVPNARPEAVKPPFPVKYIDEDSSAIVVTVRGEANQLDPIRLK